MQVSVWVPIVIAVIAAYPVWVAARAQRATSDIEKETREAELAISGLASLVGELQEERKECKDELVQVKKELRACQERVRNIERELIT